MAFPLHREVSPRIMGAQSRPVSWLPSEQRTIRAGCFHPRGTFIRFDSSAIEQSIPERFERQVARYPDRVAVRTASGSLTYADLNRVANGSAHTLLSRRGRVIEPVALLLDKDARLIAAILSVLKAGKIYVPLDTALPRARLRSILGDLQAGMIVTDARHLDFASELAEGRLDVLNIDEMDGSRGNQNPGLLLAPDTPAYILYTSGSTGQPKGVVQNHRNVLNKIMHYTNDVHLCAEDRMSLLPSCSFEAAVRDLFGALLNGASVFPLNLRDEGLASLASFVIEQEITIYHSTPTVFRHFCGLLGGQEDFSSLRLIYLGGEPVSKLDVALYQRHFEPQCILVNEWGSTEHGTGCQYFIDKRTELKGSVVPIGYPVCGVEILVLEESGQEAPSNEIGELAIRSRYLSPGYWRKPEITAAAFQPDPREKGTRIYRTGDLGRLSSDGCVEHLGRKDFQVKIRGHRIEPAEIELALSELATVKEVVVVAREEKSGEPALVAYVVPAQPSPPPIPELRRAVQGRLPEYMVPSAFVFLDAIPLTATGKRDRRALPPPPVSGTGFATGFEAPRSPVEATLVSIWADALNRGSVGIHDQFLDLGGNSVLASQIAARVAGAFGVDVSLRELFEASTVAGMAMAIMQHGAGRLDEKDLARLVAEIETMPDEEL